MTPDPALAYARPDAEWLVHEAIADLGGTVVYAYATTEVEAPANWAAAVDIQVDTRAATKRAARERADEVRRRVCAMPWKVQSQGAVLVAHVTGGPWWEPDPTGAPCYITRYRVTVRPRRAGRPAVPPAAPPVDPALSYARPDVEWLVRETVRPLGGTVTWAYAAADGGAGPRGWRSVTDIQVDVRAASKRAAYTRADEVRRAVCSMPWTVPRSRGVVSNAVTTDGPHWVPDGVGHPRYVVRFALTVHPARRLS